MCERVNVEKILGMIKNNKNDIIKNDTLINYILLEKTLSLSEKIKALLDKSINALKINDILSFNYFSSKVTNLYLKNKENRNLSDEDLLIISNSIYEASIKFENLYPLLSIFHLYLAKEILLTIPTTKRKQENKILSFYENIYKIDINKEEKYKFENNKTLINDIKNILENPNQNNSNKSYVVDKNWYTNCVHFINSIYLYCGPINNTFLLNEKDFWYDPSENYTNIFIDKNIKFDCDFLIIPENNYNILKSTFGIYDIFEIERYNNEVFLLDLKILILSKLFIEKKRRII